MCKIPSAAERARWLAEVAQALDQAQVLVERISGESGQRHANAELRHRIELAKQVTRSLRLSSDRRLTRPTDPN